MSNSNWFDPFNSNWGRGQWQGSHNSWPQVLPTQTAPTQYEPARVSPTQQYVQTNQMNRVVPHYHPSHLTTVNQHMTNHQHHFPHTQSVVNEYCETQTMCGTPFKPRTCGCSKCRGRR